MIAMENFHFGNFKPSSFGGYKFDGSVGLWLILVHVNLIELFRYGPLVFRQNGEGAREFEITVVESFVETVSFNNIFICNSRDENVYFSYS